MEAIVLAGGFGTRLKHVVSNVPKPMAPINNIPFLEYLLNYLIKNNINHFILAVGYKNEIIKNYFGNSFKGIPISYSVEEKPLKTGGAIKKALQKTKSKNVFVFNGDTYYDVDLAKMKDFHIFKKSLLTIAIKTIYNCNRYGSVVVENDIVKRFNEKNKVKNCEINGGIYLINKSIFNSINDKSFSFEEKILKSNSFKIYAYKSNSYFIDIGIPKDYYKAQRDFKNIRSLIYE